MNSFKRKKLSGCTCLGFQVIPAKFNCLTDSGDKLYVEMLDSSVNSIQEKQTAGMTIILK